MQKRHETLANTRSEGEYKDGTYTSARGYNASGLNCPKGTTLYDSNMAPAIFYQPDDLQEGETFEMINPAIAPEMTPNYYAVSNYGRVMNVRSGDLLKPDLSSAYVRHSLSANIDGELKNRKYQVHRLVLGTFHPCEGMENLQVNHINLNKRDNYVDKIMPDGSIESNLEWCTGSENIRHQRMHATKLTYDRACELRKLHDEGYSYSILCDMNNDLGYNTIKYACENKTFVDPNYTPSKESCASKIVQRKTGPKGLTDEDVINIRRLYKGGFKQVEIQSKFYPMITVGTISNIVTGTTYGHIKEGLDD